MTTLRAYLTRRAQQTTVARHLDARARARQIIARATGEALLVGDYTEFHPDLTDGAILHIIDEDAHHVVALTPRSPRVHVELHHDQIVRLDTTVEPRPYDWRRDGL